MNTRLFFFSVAAIVLAACTQMENPSESNVPVSLSYSTVEAIETKAAQNLNEGTFASGESVKVRISNTGADSWTDYTFTTAAAGAMTAPDPAPYYPAGSQNIDIVAYYPATAGSSFTVATDQTADASYKASDLMFASVTNQAKQAEAVNLAFSHKMAKINVNITATQLLADDFIPNVQRILGEEKLDPGGLILELTERCKEMEFELLNQRVQELKNTGIRVALDDMGTGYSTLDLLLHLHANEIKLDMSFTSELQGDENHELLAAVLCQAAQKRDVEICFEGVETKELLEYLKEYGDVLVQGYYFDRPLLPEEFENKYCV